MAKKAVIQNSVLTGTTVLAVAPGADVEIRNSAGGLTTLYTDRDASGGVANPFTADADGFFQVYVTPGRYQVTATAGAVVQTFEDVIAKAMAEPIPDTDFIRVQADAQSILAPAALAPVTLDGAKVEDWLPNAALSLNAADITAALLGAGFTGYLDIDYALTFVVMDGVGAAVDGDIVDVATAIDIDGTSLDPSKSFNACHAWTGGANIFTLNGHALVEVDGTSAVVIELMVSMAVRSSGTMQIDISDRSYLAVRRIIAHQD